MAQPYVTGPAHIYVGTPGNAFGSSSSAFYLGTCEQSPIIEIRPDWEPVFNDIRGGKKPLDLAFEGEEAFTFADLTRYNEGVYAALASRPRSASALAAGPTRGLNVPGDIGTLVITEKQNIVVWVVFPYAAKAAMGGAGMPAGYRFPFSVFEGPDQLRPLGTKPRKVHVVFHHMAGYDPNSGNLFCYDHNTNGLPPPN